MNLILLHPEDFVSQYLACLRSRRLEHVVNVHRAKVGSELHVGLLGGLVGKGLITRIEGQCLEIEVSLDRQPPPKLPLALVIALPRPKALNRTIQAATSLGASEIVLFNAWKVEKSYWDSPRLSEGNLFNQRVLGLEQAKDTVLPGLRLERFFAPFVGGALPEMSGGGLRLVAHPGASSALPDKADGPCTLVLGPEGGFVPDEVAALEKIGFQPVRIGQRILRTETALAAAVGRLYAGC